MLVKIPPTIDRVRNVFSVKSVVPNQKTGQAGDYAPGAMQIGYRVVQDEVAWKAIEERFRLTRDKDGRPMSEVCREYWERKRRGS